VICPTCYIAGVTETQLQAYIRARYPKETGYCEWKEFKSLRHAVTGRKGEDIASYVSAIANMEGGHLVVGVEDGSLRIVGIHDFILTPQTTFADASPASALTLTPRTSRSKCT
jgi:predicted HTH transcriptional regulator